MRSGEVCLRGAVRLLIASTLLAAAACVAGEKLDDSNPDALWRIVHDCVAASTSRCPKPIDQDIASSAPRCPSTTQVWAKDADFVAIRDMKMCGCGEGFVHGLAIPFQRIVGIEAKDLPDRIWRFAWDAARTHIDDEASIALVINPPLGRTQDQLHIHLVRLRPGARGTFAEGFTVNVAHLEEVWSTARKIAGERGLQNYGLLVAKAVGAYGFTLLVQEFAGRNAPEGLYTESTCAR